MAKAFNEVTVRCTNSQCVHFGEDRVATFPIVGNGLFQTGGIMCECGHGGECVRVQGE